MTEAPRKLLLHIDRVAYNGVFRILDQAVEMPLVLDVAPFMSADAGPRIYDIDGVMHHHAVNGSAQLGHYT
ncbi:unnamed protein product, partial [Laminaria digitata]